ncbi:uncharacterized protein LOC106074391 [Biomphalaria glabrata]|uniref:Uncharacterized protein LOC106074391 n=1 Tax=Biomphalaria glabrata TaxID=6526 RepID=A0A9W2YEU8_BIOGL|nr:uncharacterized protein LOC106074391 [Biomphalaria glabrata]
MSSPYRKLCLTTSLLTSAIGFITFMYWTSLTSPAQPFKTQTLSAKNNLSLQMNVNISKPQLQKPTQTDKTIYSFSNLQEEVETLSETLLSKLKNYRQSKNVVFKPTCQGKRYRSNSCDGSDHCLQTQLPLDPVDRVAQLVTPERLRLTQQHRKALQEMGNSVRARYDVIIVTAASSNHFLETQALLKNIHANVFPYLRNYSLIFYDIGLTTSERSAMQKFCRCTVLDFPFHKFPNFTSQLRCYSWKPVIIKSQLPNANVVVWADASVRFIKGAITAFVGSARQHGLQLGGSYSCSSIRTARSMYHYFGDEPCAYFCLGQAKATVGVYHNEYFVDRAILEPWVACALSQDCMCPTDLPNTGCSKAKVIEAQLSNLNQPIMYGVCHRFDQSAISIIIHKLYQNYYKQIFINNHPFCQILRRDTEKYFPEEDNVDD